MNEKDQRSLLQYLFDLIFSNKFLYIIVILPKTGIVEKGAV